jgi:hypothetical protein
VKFGIVYMYENLSRNSRCGQNGTQIAGTLHEGLCTRWFKYDRDDLCVNKSQFVPVIFEPPCMFTLYEIFCSSSPVQGNPLLHLDQNNERFGTANTCLQVASSAKGKHCSVIPSTRHCLVTS